VDGSLAKRARGLSPIEIDALSRLVLSAARRMSTEQIVVLIGALHTEVRRRRESATAQWRTIGPKLKARSGVGFVG